MSMRNLHKIYEPPIPRHLIPTNNPFYNKSILSPSDVLFKKVPYVPPEADHQPNNKQTSPRSLLNWINSSNTKKI